MKSCTGSSVILFFPIASGWTTAWYIHVSLMHCDWNAHGLRNHRPADWRRWITSIPSISVKEISTQEIHVLHSDGQSHRGSITTTAVPMVNSHRGKDLMLHRLTLPKGVYSFRYFEFLSPMRIPHLLTLEQTASAFCPFLCLFQWFTWECGILHWGQEVPEWVYAFWKCKPVALLNRALAVSVNCWPHQEFVTSITYNHS